MTMTHTISMPEYLSTKQRISNAKYDGQYTFSCGNSVPVYEVSSIHALNRIVGYAKYINEAYGNVYYRGECRLHPSLKPSLYRHCRKGEKKTKKLSAVIQKIYNDPTMKNHLNLGNCECEIDKIKIEGILQHYGVPTRFVDVVDNHWVALWMGLYSIEKPKEYKQYYHYTKRSVPLVEFAKGDPVSDELLFQYLLLIAVPFPEKRALSGIQISSDYIEVDLRQAVPSYFLRPHAQHGLLVRRKVHFSRPGLSADEYDMASAVIGIIKMRIDRVNEWLGQGDLLSQENLFPPPAYDFGYDLLLSKEELFSDKDFSIAKYV